MWFIHLLPMFTPHFDLGDGFCLPVMGPKPLEAGGQIACAATVSGDWHEVHLSGVFCCGFGVFLRHF